MTEIQSIPQLVAGFEGELADQPLLVFDDRELSYGGAARQSAVLARQLLDAGIGKGDRVAMIFPNSPEFVVSWLAITRIGAVAVPLSTLATAWELGRMLSHCDARWLISADRFLNHDYGARLDSLLGLAGREQPLSLPAFPHLRGVWIWGRGISGWPGRVDLTVAPRADADLLAAAEAAVRPADPVTIIYTSGTTSEPKGVIHGQGGFMRQAAKMAAMYPYEPGERCFTVMPFFWVGGLMTGVLTCIRARATVLCSAHKGRPLLDFIERTRPGYVLMWPNLAQAMASDPSFAARDFTFIKSAGVADRVFPHLAGHRRVVIGNSLGMTETAGPHTTILPYVPADMPDSMGPSAPGIEHRVVDLATGTVLGEGQAGELQVRGDTLMLGYVGREWRECFTADGWFATGDLCEIRNGHVLFHGRCDDMIKSYGANVSPAEVEQVLMDCPAVAQAIVVGVPHPQKSQVVGAAVVLKPGCALEVAKLLDHARGRLSNYKVPSVLKIIEETEIEVTASGKIKKHALAKMLAGVAS